MASRATKRGRPADESPPTAARGRFEPGALRTDAFKRLKHGACADAYHDFKSKGFNKARTADVRKPGLADVLLGLDDQTGTPVNSIPTAAGAEKLRIENDMLLDLFAGTGLASERLVRSILQDTIGTAPRYEKTYRLNGLYGPTDYRVRLLAKEDQPNVQALIAAGRLTVGDVINVLSPTAAAASFDLNLVVDMSILSLLDMFKSLRDDGARELRVNFLVNRELVNDPAPKTYEDNRTRPTSSKVKVNFLYDAEKGPIFYTHNTRALEETGLERDKFFSKFDFQLGPLQHVPKRLPKITVDIVHGQKKIYHNTDPHENNAIAACWKRILSVFKSRAAKHQEAAANFQCKRSGDWLQALSCFDMGREYRNMTTNAVSKLAGTSIVLVTHDVVLLWYALFMGVNVLFTTKTNPNSGAADEPESVDEAAVDDGRSPKYILYFQGLKSIETPAEKTERLLEQCRTLTEGAPLETIFTSIRTYRDAYETAVEAIQRDTRTAIQSFAALTPTTLVDLTKTLNSILRAYYKKQSFKVDLESLEWMEQLRAAPFQAAYTTPTSIRDSPDATIQSLLPLSELLVSKLTDYTVRMRTVPQDQLQAYLEITHAAYMKDELYANLPSLLSIQRTSRNSNEITRALELVDVLQTAMRSLDEHLELYTILSTIRANRVLDRGKSYVLDTCLDVLSKYFLTVYDDAETSAEEKTAIQNTLRTHPPGNEAIRREVEQMVLRAMEQEQTELFETAQEAERLEELPELRDTVAEELATESAELATVAAEDAAAGKQTKFKFAKAFPSLGSIFRTLAGRLYAELTGRRPPGEAARGGGSSKSKRGAANSYTLLVAVYLRELQQTILTLDYTDPDAVFYDCAARLALSVLGPDPKRTAEALYGTLPTADFQVLGVFQSKWLATNVAFAARQVALHALGLSTGAPSLLPAVPLTAAELQTYAKTRKTYTTQPEERQNQLAIAIGRAIITLTRSVRKSTSKTRKVSARRTSATSKSKSTSQRKRASVTRRTKRSRAFSATKQLAGQTRRVARPQPN